MKAEAQLGTIQKLSGLITMITNYGKYVYDARNGTISKKLDTTATKIIGKWKYGNNKN